MDKRQLIGLILIFALFFLWSLNNTKSKQIADKSIAQRDSIAQIQLDKRITDSLAGLPIKAKEENTNAALVSANDSIVSLRTQMQFGAFAKNVSDKGEIITLENDKVVISFDTKGGKIVDVLLKEHKRVFKNSEGKKDKAPVELLNNVGNKFSYKLPVKGVPGGVIDTEDLVFQATKSGNSIVFTAGENKEFTQTYQLKDDYEIDYNLGFSNGPGSFSDDKIILNWKNYLGKMELNDVFEKSYSTVYFKEVDEDSDYCSCRKSDTEISDENPVVWVSNVNQFFNTSIVAKDAKFTYGKYETDVLTEKAEELKLITTELHIPATAIATGSFPMMLYAGPNEFEKLKSYDIGLEEIIPFGRSLFGTINRWVIRPLFNFFDALTHSKGLAIILMILLIKIVLYPLTYKMLHSQAKMGALKPELAGLKEKYKDDPQTQQVETMKIYREYGVSPLGGCMPMLIQMPIWYALFRFFPASIGFRQESFWWADDLSSFDAFVNLPFDIPFMGSHLSLFTFLWVISQLVYTYYNTKHMDMTANPAMKYIQYVMPIMFLFFFNQYASGLTVYMFFSNLFNIAQTIGTKELVFNEDKLRQGLMANKLKPKKKKSKFMESIESAVKQQQEIKKSNNKPGKK